MSKADIEALRERLVAAAKRDDTLTTEALAQRYGVSKSAVLRWLRHEGVRSAPHHDGLSLRARGRRSA